MDKGHHHKKNNMTAFGGCMILLNKDIASGGLNCPARLFSLSCDGTHNSVMSTGRILDSAQMAFALEKNQPTGE
jgi:hypothetical protein